jgi:phage tail-like protein
MASYFDRAKKGTQTGNAGGDFSLSSKFVVEIANMVVGGFKSVEGLKSANDTLAYKDNDATRMSYRAGNLQPIKFSLTRDWCNNNTLHDWFMKGANGTLDRRSVSFVSMTDAGEEISRINVGNAWVTNWSLSGFDSKGSGHLQEKVDCVAETIEYK